MIEIDGMKYLTKEELLKVYDDFTYLLNFKDSMIECYKKQVEILEESVDKLLTKIKENNNEKTSN